MEKKTLTFTKLIASEGMWLTDGNGTYSKEVFLGSLDSEENWHEEVDEIVQQKLKEKEEAINKDANANASVI